MNSPYRRRHRQGNGLLFLILIMAFAASRSCDKRTTSTPPLPAGVSTPVRNPIQDVLRPVAPAQYREGIVAAILVDTSGSMKETVRDADGALKPKISIAQRAALNLVNQFDNYAREHSAQPNFLVIYEFSDRVVGSSCRSVIALGPPAE